MYASVKTHSKSHITEKSGLRVVGLALAALALIGIIASNPCQAAYAAQDGNAQSGSLTTSAAQLTTAATKSLPKVSITPTTETPDANLRKSNTYTKQLKNYWVMTYYMQLFEKKGGGTLILKKGTYQLPVSVQVPSNVTIIFQDGVIINKIKNTGTSRISANTPLFQMVAPSKYKKTASVGNYNGTKNVKFIGKGTVIFDMKKGNPGCAIVMAQNQNMKFSGITFRNLASHAFELDASKNVVIDNCKFLNATRAGKTIEAINLDTPDSNTGGFSFKWCKMDKKPNVNITIKNCTFKNLNRGIGTHKYSQTAAGKNIMHTNIKILNNTFINIAGIEGCIVAMNWKNVAIKGNTIDGKGKNYSITASVNSRKTKVYSCAIVLHSTQGAVVINNTISDFKGSIAIRRGFSASGYKVPATVSLAAKQKKLLAANKYKEGTVTYPDATMTSQSYYSWVMMTTWTQKHYANVFKSYPLESV